MPKGKEPNTKNQIAINRPSSSGGGGPAVGAGDHGSGGHAIHRTRRAQTLGKAALGDGCYCSFGGTVHEEPRSSGIRRMANPLLEFFGSSEASDRKHSGKLRPVWTGAQIVGSISL